MIICILNITDKINCFNNLEKKYLYNKYKNFINIIETDDLIKTIYKNINKNVSIKNFINDNNYIYQCIFSSSDKNNNLSEQLILEYTDKNIIIIKRDLYTNSIVEIKKEDIIDCIISRIIKSGVYIYTNNKIKEYKYIYDPYENNMIINYGEKIIFKYIFKYYLINTNLIYYNKNASMLLNETIYGDVFIIIKRENTCYNLSITKENIVKLLKKYKFTNNIDLNFPQVRENFILIS